MIVNFCLFQNVEKSSLVGKLTEFGHWISMIHLHEIPPVLATCIPQLYSFWDTRGLTSDCSGVPILNWLPGQAKKQHVCYECSDSSIWKI